MERIDLSDERWRQRLTPEQYRVLRQKGTEPPFSNRYYHEKGDGRYHCAACGNEIFSASAKYDSGTGWPSFREPVIRDSVAETADNNLGMARAEVSCARCNSHLGHVFPDGPAPTGRRYCINSLALDFRPADQTD